MRYKAMAFGNSVRGLSWCETDRHTDCSTEMKKPMTADTVKTCYYYWLLVVHRGEFHLGRQGRWRLWLNNSLAGAYGARRG